MLAPSRVLAAGVALAVPVGVVIALGVDVLPFQAQPAPAEGEPVAVELVHVIDGDTIIVDRDGEEERVRVLGIDAPEVAREGESGERCADEATALTEELTAGAEVVVVADSSQEEADRYGRTLAYVEADGQDVSAELLSAGLAEVYESAPDIARYADYEALAGQAATPSCA